jgi:hypothetical protein
VFCKSHNVKIIQDAGSVFNTKGKDNCGVCGKMGCIYSSFCNFLVQHVRYNHFDSYPVFCWLMNTNSLGFNLAQPPGPSCMRRLETRFSPRGEERVRCQVLLL